MPNPRTDMPLALTPEQHDLVTGTMLGDATINRKHRYYSFSQQLLKHEYVCYVGKVLEPFTIHYDQRTTKEGWERSTVRTCTCQVFKDLRNVWYVGRTKIVPEGLIINPKIVGYWFSDDGYHLAKRKRLELSTNSFQDNEVRRLIDLLKGLGIKSGLHRDSDRKPIIRIKQRSYFDFLDMVRPYIPWKCMAYKLDMTETPKTREGWGANKLDYSKARQIRHLCLQKDMTQAVVGKLFGVSRRMVNLIVNNKAWAEADVGLRGGADVTVRYNFVANSSSK
jgi:hypothetical protein